MKHKSLWLLVLVAIVSVAPLAWAMQGGAVQIVNTVEQFSPNALDSTAAIVAEAELDSGDIVLSIILLALVLLFGYLLLRG